MLPVILLEIVCQKHRKHDANIVPYEMEGHQYPSIVTTLLKTYVYLRDWSYPLPGRRLGQQKVIISGSFYELEVSIIALSAVKVNSEPAERTVHPPPYPPSQKPTTMVPKCTLGSPEYNLTCFLGSHWDALELLPLAFSRSPAKRSSLSRYLNHTYILVLWHNGPNVV